MSSDIRSVTYDTGIAVTASDTANDPSGPFVGFYVGSVSGGTTVKVTTVRGDTLTLAGVQAGLVYPIGIRRVWSSTTTASSIIGLKAPNDVL